ncbi:MAG: RNA polymerase sigma factor [Verrucomicrobiales bacterium]
MDEQPPRWDDELALVKQGDQNAARRLVEALYPKIIRIIRNHLPVTVDEQDIAQDVFMKMFTKLEQFRGTQPFDHWVARITLNTCYDRLRQQKARRVMSYADFPSEEAEFLADLMAGREHEDNSAAANGYSLEVLDILLATLKPAEQMILRLLDLEEKSVQEICGLTGWGASRVKVTAFRARKKLADTFQRLETTPRL